MKVKQGNQFGLEQGNEQTCSCGHDHGDGCSCGHDHETGCSCGHDHETGCCCGHEHETGCCSGHEHETGCCCVHEHETGCCGGHDHGDGCCSGHEHETGCCGGHDHGDGCCCGANKAQKPRVVTPSFQAQDPNKGVSLGKELETEIAEVMRKRYARFLSEDERFTVKTEVCHHFGLVSSVLDNPGRTTHVCAEVSVECEENKIENPMDAYSKALDVLDLVWLDYFDGDRIMHYLPIWQSYEIDSMSVNVRFEHSNPALDDAATEFLKAHGYLEGGLSPDDYDE